MTLAIKHTIKEREKEIVNFRAEFEMYKSLVGKDRVALYRELQFANHFADELNLQMECYNKFIQLLQARYPNEYKDIVLEYEKNSFNSTAPK